MRKYLPIIRVTCVILSLVMITGIFASCKKKTQEVVATTESTTLEEITEESTEETSEETTEESTTESTTTSTTKAPYKEERDAEFPYTLCSYTTKYNSGNKARTTNLKVASSKINNMVIPVGSIFSFNGTVGERSKARGFKDAIVFSNNKEEKGIGGGICQVSSTIFQAALRSNCEIVSRRAHSLKVSYVPLGCDATVMWGSQDFKFKNNHPCDIKIKVSCDGGKLTCKILAKENIDFGNIKISVTGSEKNCTLVRYCNGVKNYTTVSRYNNGSDKNVNVNIENKPEEGAKPVQPPVTPPTPTPTPPPYDPSTPSYPHDDNITPGNR